MYTTFTVVGDAAKLFKNKLYILIVILVTFLNGNATAILKKKRPKPPLILHRKYVNFRSYSSRCEKMYNFMHLIVHIPDFLMNPFVLCFCSGRCRVYFYRSHFGFADVYSSQ